MTHKKHLHLGDGFTLPIEIATETAAILAVKRAGKSNAGVVIAEELFDAGVPWTAVDPKGDWWGVRAAGDGRAKGLPVVVFGGEHADVPLEPTSGKLLARLVAQKRLTCVLDVSTMTKADQRRFLTDFAEELYRLNREPMHLFCEEADEYIPQQVRGESARMVGAFETLVKRGGFKGIGVTLITQRSASLNKDVLTQAGTLVAMRTPSPQDRKAVLAWIEQHAASKEIIDELPKLASGEAWVFSTLREPELQKVKFRRRRTFDSGATPKVGEKITPPATLADVDLAAISAEMAETIERAKAEDPRELRKQVAELKAELARTKAEKPVGKVETKVVEKPVLKDGQLARAEKLGGELAAAAKLIADAIGRTRQPDPPTVAGHEPKPWNRVVPIRTPAPPRPPKPDREPVQVGDITLTPRLREMLETVAAYTRETPTIPVKRLAALMGMKVAGGFNNYLGALNSAGLLARANSAVGITEAGLEAIGGRPLAESSTEEILEKWRPKLPGKAMQLLEHLVSIYPQDMSIEEAAQFVGMAVAGGFNNYVGMMNTRSLIVRQRGRVSASPTLFPSGEVAHG